MVRCPNLHIPQLAALGHTIQPVGVGELDHLYGILDGLSVAVHTRRSLCSGDGHYIQVELRRKPSIDAQFLFAIMFAECEGAEIEKRQTDSFLDFVGVGTGEKHIGDVGL
jgi:hypothetical protein